LMPRQSRTAINKGLRRSISGRGIYRHSLLVTG
jgi:hypothetical protein